MVAVGVYVEVLRQSALHIFQHVESQCPVDFVNQSPASVSESKDIVTQGLYTRNGSDQFAWNIKFNVLYFRVRYDFYPFPELPAGLDYGGNDDRR